MNKKMHRLEVHVNAEGSALAYMQPEATTDEEYSVCYRIAGPKNWGGSQKVATLNISEDDLATYIKENAPDVIKLLKKSIDN